MARSSKDIARRLRFDHRPAPDTFRRWFGLTVLVAAVAGVVAWFVMNRGLGEKAYLPAPVTASHGLFGARCEVCHRPYQAVADEQCLKCHTERLHSEFDPAPAACRDCHVEHRGAGALMGVAATACTECHATLVSKRDQPAVERAIASLVDHPEIVPLRPPARDPAAVRFNHRVHFEAKLDEKLECVTCHRVDDEGRRMRSISFDRDCLRCHALDVVEKIGAVTVPHPSCPDDKQENGCEWQPALREEIRKSLIQLAVASPESIFEGTKILLPGRAPRGPVDESNSLRAFLDRWTEIVEGQIYKPLDTTPPLYSNNKYCVLCHLEEGEARDPGVAPTLLPTKIPSRWLARGEFHHQRHAMMACDECHTNARKSAETSDVNLPPMDECRRCHAEGGVASAGTQCSLCHRYHDTSMDRSLFMQRRALRKARLEEVLQEIGTLDADHSLAR